MKITKLILTIILIIAFLVESTGISYARMSYSQTLRPAASSGSVGSMATVLEILKGLINSQDKSMFDSSSLAKMMQLAQKLNQYNGAISKESSQSGKIRIIDESLDAILSAEMVEIVPKEITNESKQLKSEINTLLADNNISAVNNRPNNPPLSQKVKAIAVSVLMIGTIIFLMSYFRDYYLAFRQRWCIVTTFLTSVVIAGAGDYLRQKIHISLGLREKMDRRHIIGWAAVGGLLGGFLFGYLWHDLCLMADNSQRAFKIIIDQALLAPSYHIPVNLIFYDWLVEGKPFNEAAKDATGNWSRTYIVALLLWPWALPLGYFYVAAKSPVVVVLIASLIWSTALSVIVSQRGGPKTAIFDRNLKIYKAGRYFWLPGIIASFFVYPSLNLAVVCCLAISWIFFFSYKLKKIERAHIVKTADELKRHGDLEDRYLALQGRLVKHIFTELKLHKEPAPEADSSKDIKASPTGSDNLYGGIRNMMRGLVVEDRETGGWFSRAVSSAQQAAGLENRKARVLLIGAGAGRIIYDLERKFPGVQFTSINKENIEVGPADFSDVTEDQYIHGEGDFVTKEEAEGFLTSFKQRVMVYEFKNTLPFTDGEFDVVFVAQATIEYIEEKALMIAEAKRVLRKNGTAVIRWSRGFHVYGVKTSKFFSRLGEEYKFMLSSKPYPASVGIGTLVIVNKNPEKPFPHLKKHLPAKWEFVEPDHLLYEVVYEPPPSRVARAFSFLVNRVQKHNLSFETAA